MASRETLDEMAHFDDLLGVKPHGRLVQNDDVRIVDQGLRQADALFVSARQPLDQLGALVAKIGFLDRVVHASAPPFRRNILDPQNEVEIGAHRHIGIERGRLGQIADVTAHLE